MLEFAACLAAVLFLGPALTALAARKLLPALPLGPRLALAAPQAILFALGAVLRARAGWFSSWELLMWSSVVVGQALGFGLAWLLTRSRT